MSFVISHIYTFITTYKIVTLGLSIQIKFWCDNIPFVIWDDFIRNRLDLPCFYFW